MRNLHIVLITLLISTSCRQEGYDIKLRSTEAILIVDARVQSHESNIIVNLSQSTGFLGDNPKNSVDDASVFIKIDDENETQLNFLEEGDYELGSIKIDEGTQYQLRIVWNDKEYISTSTMLAVVPINFVIFEETTRLGGGRRDHNGEDIKTYNFNMFVDINLQQSDYYITEAFVFDTITKEFIDRSSLPWDDELYDSSPALFPYFVSEYEAFSLVNIRFSHIPKEVNDFYNSLNEVEGQDPSSLAPSNPLSNISNGAIGSFGAFATYDTTVIVFP